MDARGSLLVILLAVLIGVLTTSQPSEASGPGSDQFIYSVKFLCGIVDPFTNVFLWTEINIHNPTESPVEIKKKFLLSGTEEKPTDRFVIKTRQLRPNEAFTIDCQEILPNLLVSVGKGFVEIISPVKLQVVGIYDKCVKLKPKVPTIDGDVPTPPTIDVFLRSEALVGVTFEAGPLKGQSQTLLLMGPTKILREPPLIHDGKLHIKTQIIELKLQGLKGHAEEGFTLRLDPDAPASSGAIEGSVVALPNVSPVIQPPFDSSFDVFFEIETPDGTVVRPQDAQGKPVPIHMEARLFPEILPEPPIEDPITQTNFNQYEHRATPEGIALFDKRTGQRVARVDFARHIPVPKPPECEDVSLDVEYVSPVLVIRLGDPTAIRSTSPDDPSRLASLAALFPIPGALFLIVIGVSLWGIAIVIRRTRIKRSEPL